MATFPGTRHGSLLLTGPANVYYFYLSPESRQAVDAVLNNIDNWHHDELFRSRSRLLDPDENLYSYIAREQARVFVFRVLSDEIEVVTIFDEGWLRASDPISERSAV